MSSMMMWPWIMTQNTDNIVQGSANQQAIVNGINTIQQNQQAAAVAAMDADSRVGIMAAGWMNDAYGNETDPVESIQS